MTRLNRKINEGQKPWRKKLSLIVVAVCFFSLGFTFYLAISIESEVNLTGSTELAATVLDGLVLFIHVGKAGGATMYFALNSCESYECLTSSFRKKKKALECRIKNQPGSKCWSPSKNETVLSERTLGRLHVTSPEIEKFSSEKTRTWVLDNTSIFLYSMRDPITRIISAYNYHRQEFNPEGRRFYKRCFPSVGEMVKKLHRNGGDMNVKSCRKIGLELLMGTFNSNKTTYLSHIKYGYRYYMKRSLDKRPNHTVAVIRTENLWEDLIHMDRLVGGDGHWTRMKKQVTHGSQNFKYSSDISPDGINFLCCVIYDDMDAYQTLIIKAANLNDTQKRETLLAVMSHCQIDTSGTDVLENPFSWPSFYNDTCKSSVEMALAYKEEGRDSNSTEFLKDLPTQGLSN
mmetsp:Transcript_25505/g.31345  ORF Transcript_25505/g.31345 Transcript_25505/m.31345 type:complete len:402 (+) Transcript_25505:82-1287(+)